MKCKTIFGLSLLTIIGSLAMGQQPVQPASDLCGSSVNTTAVVNWPKYDFDLCNSGHNPYEFLLSPTTVGKLTLKWRYKSTPTFGLEGEFSAPTVVEGILYVASRDNHVYALNAKTGELVWKYAVGNWVISSPTVANGVVYFGSADDNLYAVDAKTGKFLWKYATGSAVYSSPAVVNGVVYFGSYDWNVYALNAATGVLVWKYKTDSYVAFSPAVVNGMVYITAWNGSVYALNATTGSVVWRVGLGGGTSPAVVAGMVFVGRTGNYYLDGVEYALDANNGKTLWSYVTGSFGTSDVAVAKGVAYFSSEPNLYDFYAVNATTGELLWKVSYGGYSSPIVANGVVYMVSGNLNLNARDATTGVLLWSYAPPLKSYSAPVIANGMLYVGTREGTMYAFGLPDQ